jgi:hypothetical protein
MQKEYSKANRAPRNSLNLTINQLQQAINELIRFVCCKLCMNTYFNGLEIQTIFNGKSLPGGEA